MTSFPETICRLLKESYRGRRHNCLCEPAASVEFDRASRDVTAYLTGELDQASVPAILATTLGHIRPDDEHVWMDASAITFCGSAGLAMLITLHQQVKDDGGRLVVYNPAPQLRRLIDVCDAGHVLAVRT